MKRRILVVDDEERIRAVVQVCLEELAGWEVILAGSARDGLALAKTEAIDAILLDVSMPDMDGAALFHQLQAAPETADIPVILLTAKSTPADQSSFLNMGVTGLIAKPFDALTLPQQIAAVLGWTSGDSTKLKAEG
jgi:CheY-like chemotaxis protein